MGQITGYTAAKTQELLDAIRDETIVDAHLSGTNLILTTGSGTEINVGNVQGPQGNTGGISEAQLLAATRVAGCKVTRSAAQVISSGAMTQISFTGTEERDTDAFHSTSVNPNRITIPSNRGGWYDVKGLFTIDSGTTGWEIIMELRKNGNPAERLLRLPSANAPTMTLSGSTEIGLVADDYLELSVFQDSGGNKNVTNASISVHFLAAV